MGVFLNGESFVLTEGNERIIVTEKTVVMTTETDPFDWWSIGYEYPQYTWYEDNGVYTRADPINLAWENTDLNTVKSRICSQGWWDWTLEYIEYVSDPQNSWVQGDGLGTGPVRIFGGYHVRLFDLSTQDIVGGAHRDSWVPHEVTELETAENLVGGLFDNDLSNWWVLYDYEELDNEEGTPNVEPFCDGEATCMWRVGARS